MITVELVKHSEQRYDTVGDWQFDPGMIAPGSTRSLKIKVSETGVPEYNQLLTIHEIIEAVLCKNAFIGENEVDHWDQSHLVSPDPGSIKGCPYYDQHRMASIIERMLADEMGVDWDDYEKTLEEL